MTRFPFHLALLACALVSHGCAPAAESSAQPAFSDSAGIRIVFNREGVWEENRSWTVAPQPAVTIGVLSGPDVYQLVDVTDVARRSDGSLVVLDYGAQTVRIYDAGGAYLETLGGPGSGPGEFTGPTSVLVTAGDSVVVWDQALLRATYFDPAGRLAEVRSVDWGSLATVVSTAEAWETLGKDGKATSPTPGNDLLFPGALEPMEDGTLLVRLTEKAGEAPGSGFYRPRSGLLRIDFGLTAVDTLQFFGDVEQVVVGAPWGPFSLSPALGKRTEFAHRGNPPRICIGDQEEAEILCFESDGGRTSVRWSWAPRPVTQVEIAAWREATVHSLEVKMSRSQVLEALAEAPLPEARPPYASVILDGGMNLWVEQGPTPGSGSETVDFLVFDSPGVLLGVVSMPPVKIMEIGDDYIVGLYRDEFDVQFLHVYELRKPRRDSAPGE